MRKKKKKIEKYSQTYYNKLLDDCAINCFGWEIEEWNNSTIEEKMRIYKMLYECQSETKKKDY